jgi:hypothetical protein
MNSMSVTDIIISIEADSRPVSLSTGVPVFGRQLNKTAILIAKSGCWGESRFGISNQAPGPRNPGWGSSAWARPYAKGDERRFKAAGGCHNERHVPFSALSEPTLFWVEDDKYTHVLMDARNRRMVGVRPFKSGLSTSVWRLVKSGLEDPDGFCDRESMVINPAPGYHPDYYDLQDELGDKVLFVALHPAPVLPGAPAALWCFEGKNSILIRRDEDGNWESGFETTIALEEEEIEQLANDSLYA